MKWSLAFVLRLLTAGAGCSVLSAPPASSATLAVTTATWQTGYTGSEATGPKVLGYWKFEPEHSTADSSGHGGELKLEGAVAVAEGWRDGALECFAGPPAGDDKLHAAIAGSSPGLSPKGAFTIEMWIRPKPEQEARLSPVLIDKKYVSDHDYQWRLTPAAKSGTRRLQVTLGFGDSSETFFSDPFLLGAEWQHVAFTYDGAGTVHFHRNGASLGGMERLGRGAVSPGTHPLSIGDRVGSTYSGFPGLIDEVRITEGVQEFRPVAVEFDLERRTWLRMEKVPPIRVVARNLSQAPARGLKLRVFLEGETPREFALPDLAPGAAHKVEFPFDSSLRPDVYRLHASLVMAGEIPFATDESIPITLVARPLARMPVLMWGIGSPEGVKTEMSRLEDLGFTHCLGRNLEGDAVWAAGRPVPLGSEADRVKTAQMLDLALANNLGIAFALWPDRLLKERPELRRVDRQGQPYKARPDVDAALPGLAEYCFNVGASVAQTYSAFPAWQAALIDSETRDSSQLSFSEFDRQAYRKFSGQEIPPEAVDKGGVNWAKIKGFPADRIIPDDDPLLKYYHWWWTMGDGWNGLQTAVHQGIHSQGRDDVWTWFDPAIRAPSVGGSGGAVDVLSQWSYSNPDPLRVGCFCDELFAMAANSPQHPRVMKMTQLIWYRSQTAPKKTGPGHIASPFDDHDPDAAYITIAPMHLREAFWSMLARPVRGLMYHGWESLVSTDSVGGYRYTNPDTQEEFRRLHRGILEPLGPTLLQVPDRPSDVAFLDSFTAQMFAHRGTYGYSGDGPYRVLLHAGLQPEVLYEDQVREGALERFKILVLSGCDVLPESVARRIQEFQRHGGLIVGDEDTTPAIHPDIPLTKIVVTKKAAEDKAAVLAAAAQLRSALESRYTRYAESSEPEIVTRVRSAGGSDYLFAINDRREFGTYVGQHGLVMENGLPSSGEIRLGRPAGHVYDLVSGREVPSAVRDGSLRWMAALGPCEGRLFLITPRPIAAVKLAAPASAALGSDVKLQARIVDASGQPVTAVVPLRLEISDPSGRRAEFSGNHAAVNGLLDLTLHIASNDAPGTWQVHASELASRQEATAYMRVAAGGN